MIRKINIIDYTNKEKHNIKDFVDWDIKNIDSIPNASIDVIYCADLAFVAQDKTSATIDTIINKTRYGGQVTFVISDVYAIAKLYVDRQISEEQFLKIIEGVKNNISYEKITKQILDNKQFDIIGIEQNKILSAVTFGRKL
jgi:hypothetical protein